MIKQVAMNEVFITGVGQAHKYSSASDSQIVLSKKAVDLALMDAGLLKEDIQAVFMETSGDVSVPVVLGLGRVAVFESGTPASNRGGIFSFQQAYEEISGGHFDVALVLSTRLWVCEESVKPVTEQIKEMNRLNRVAVEVFAACYNTEGGEVGNGSQGVRVHGALNMNSRDCGHLSLDSRLLSECHSALVLCSKRFLEKLNRPSPVQILSSFVSTSPEECTRDEVISKLVKQAYAELSLASEDLHLDEAVISFDGSELCVAELDGDTTEHSAGQGCHPVANGDRRVHVNSDFFGLSRIVEINNHLRNESSTNLGSDNSVGIAMTVDIGSFANSRCIGVHTFKKVAGN